jgi:hypothetical protein
MMKKDFFRFVVRMRENNTITLPDNFLLRSGLDVGDQFDVAIKGGQIILTLVGKELKPPK